MRGFGAPYRPEVPISRNGSGLNGTVATIDDRKQPVTRAQSRRHRQPESLDADPVASAGHARNDPEPTGHSRPPTVDEALLAVADALTELARALRHPAD
jgi:hypothetical protein